MKTRGLPLLPVLLAFVAFGSAPVQAGEPHLLSAYGSWLAYTMVEDDHKVCYMSSEPIRSDGTKPDSERRKGDPPPKPRPSGARGDAYALITDRPADNTRDVFSFIAGYTYKSGAEASLTIDDQKFVLFTQGGTAWAPDSATDAKIAKALRAGKTAVMRGVSSKGTKTQDNIKLDGAQDAYDKIQEECH